MRQMGMFEAGQAKQIGFTKEERDALMLCVKAAWMVAQRSRVWSKAGLGKSYQRYARAAEIVERMIGYESGNERRSEAYSPHLLQAGDGE